MSWQRWVATLRQQPQAAVADLLRGAAEITPFERVAPYEFLLAILPRTCRNVSTPLLGEVAHTPLPDTDSSADLPGLVAGFVDSGLAAWLRAQREAPPPPAHKFGAYAAQLCEALQWPIYFDLPQSCATLRAGRAQWLAWLREFTLSPLRDPEYDYWQLLAARQEDDALQSFWLNFVVEAGRTRSARYLNLGLLALAKLPLSEEDSLRNLRLQVQALINRYQHRKAWGGAAQEELASSLRGVMGRNPSLSTPNYRALLTDLLAPLGEAERDLVLSLVGFAETVAKERGADARFKGAYSLNPPGSPEETTQAVRAVTSAGSLAQAWKAIALLLSDHEIFMHRTGNPYYFVRNLDRCARALCDRFSLDEPKIQSRLFHWIHLSLRMDADNPLLWMLWELALRQAGFPLRAQWVLWEMTRRFPDQLPCRVELARLLAASGEPDDQRQAYRLLHQVLRLDAENLYAHSTLAQLAFRQGEWETALQHAREGLRIEPDNAPSAILLAQTYAWRNEPGDLQAAIDHLQHFVERYSGNRNTEGYLSKLQCRQQLAAQGRFVPPEAEEEPLPSAVATSPESDPIWIAFGQSVRDWVTAKISTASAGERPAYSVPPDRLLPPPQALRQAVARRAWATDPLDQYEATVWREFPLETRLWRYLQSLQPSASEAQRKHAREEVEAWLEVEARTPTEDKSSRLSWLSYLNQQWCTLNASNSSAPSSGAEWLEELLERYQPLPAQVMA